MKAPDGTDAGWIYGTIVDGEVITAGKSRAAPGATSTRTTSACFGLPSQP